jgi:hypothetical protein
MLDPIQGFATEDGILDRINRERHRAARNGQKPRFLILGDYEWARLRLELRYYQPASPVTLTIGEHDPVRIYDLEVTHIRRPEFFDFGY